MATVTCELDELLLDLDNPRISKSDSQRGALQKIIEDQDVKLVVLADSIVTDGLNPMDRWLVLKSPTERGRYIVLEGNRRLASYIKQTIKQNRLLDGEYAEAYAGGCGIALELLFHEYVSHIHINDLSKGRELYYDFYQPKDHEDVAQFIDNSFAERNWIVSYDNVPTIRALYANYQQTVYGIGYSARDVREGSEIMFFSESLEMPKLVGPFRLIRTLSAHNRKPVGRVENSKKSSRNDDKSNKVQRIR